MELEPGSQLLDPPTSCRGSQASSSVGRIARAPSRSRGCGAGTELTAISNAKIKNSLPLYRIYKTALVAPGYKIVKQAPQPNGHPSKREGVLFTV